MSFKDWAHCAMWTTCCSSSLWRESRAWTVAVDDPDDLLKRQPRVMQAWVECVAR